MLVLILVSFSWLRSSAQDQLAIDSLKQLIVKAETDTNYVKILQKIGATFGHSLPDSSFHYYQQAISVSEKIGYMPGIAECTRRIGRIQRLKGNHEGAIESYLKALGLFQEISDMSSISTCYNNIGEIYYFQGEYDKAIEYYYLALGIAEELGDKRKMGKTYNNIGIIHQNQGTFDKSIEFTEKALNLYDEIDYKNGVAICHINIGIIYHKHDSLNIALEYYEKALDIFIELKSKEGISNCYNNIGEIYRAKGIYDRSIEYALKAMELYEEMGFKEGMASAYANIASFNIGLADSLTISETQRINYLNKSVEYGDKAMELAREMKSLYIESSVANTLVQAYKRLGNYRKAIEFSEIIIATKDSMFQEEKTNAILEIETKYETEKKQQQLEIQESQIIAKDATIKQQKIYRNALGTGFLAVILIIVVIVYAYSQKRKANKKIMEQNEQILEANEELKILNEAINKQNHDIIDSISYAERIQAAMLPPSTYITELLNDNFILYKPRDIVSGDFYWVKQVNQYVVLVAADCTGHGVPGAFMSMLGISYLTEIVQRREITQANQVLNELRKQIKHSLRQHGERDESKDGIDLALCVLDLKNSRMQFSGANNPLYLIRDVDGETVLKDFKADRMPLGYYHGKDRPFTNHEIDLKQGDTFYLFSDGFIDQKGGKDNKRYMSKGFKSLLLEIQDQSMQDQKGILDKTLADWMGSNSQTDDILVIGVRV